MSANVRQLRADRGWSLDVLVGVSGVGRQPLGQIELGRSVPSLDDAEPHAPGTR